MTDVTMIIKARNESAAALSAVKGDLEQVNKAARGVGDQLKSAGDALAGAGGRLTAGVTLPLIGVGVAALSASTEARLDALEKAQRTGWQVQMSPRVASLLMFLSVMMIVLMFWVLVRLGGA